MRCDIWGVRDSTCVSLKGVIGSYEHETRCPNPAVETMYLFAGYHVLNVCNDHLCLFLCHVLDLPSMLE